MHKRIWWAAAGLALLVTAAFSIQIFSPWPGWNHASQSGDPRLDKILSAPSVHLARKIQDVDYVLINFWASWCPPCVAEMPSLIRFARGHKNFLFMSVSQDSSKKEFEQFLKAFPALDSAAEGLILDYDQSLGRAYAVEKLPETFIFNLHTKKYAQISGALDWDQASVLDQIESHFKTKQN